MDTKRVAGLAMAAPAVESNNRPDGSRILRSPRPLRKPAASRRFSRGRRRTATASACSWPREPAASRAGARSAGRKPRGRRRRSARACCARGLGGATPILALSGNSLGHALLMLGAHRAGIPFAPLSPAYSLQSRDFGKLRHAAARLDPPLVYVEQVAPFAAAPGGDRSRKPDPGHRRSRAAAGRRARRPRRPEPGRAGGRRRRAAPREGFPRAGQHRQDPLHLGLDRHAQRGDQHPRHALRQPADDRPGLAFPG